MANPLVDAMSVSFDRIADSFDRTRRITAEAMTGITCVLVKELAGRGRILDAGTGTGLFSGPLGEAGFEVVGLDISEKMLAKAREKGIRCLMLGDVRALPFRAGSFGAALCNRILHLVREWEAALREIVRVTDGVVVSVMNDRKGPYANTPNERYRALTRELGYAREHPGLTDMTERIPPSGSRLGAVYSSSVPVALQHLSEKAFSYQWNAPEDIHRTALAKVNEEFAGVERYESALCVHVWDVAVIRDYLESIGH